MTVIPSTPETSESTALPTPARRKNLRRLAFFAAGAMALAVVAVPASARTSAQKPQITDDEFVISVGQDIKKDYPAIVGDDVRSEVEGEAEGEAPNPSICKTEMGCVDIPIALNVPAASIPNNQLALTVTVSWKVGVTAPGLPDVGTLYGDNIQALLWDTPERVGEFGNTYTATASLEPAVVEDDSPLGSQVDLVVDNQIGVNQGFSIEARLLDDSVQGSYYPPGSTPAPVASPTYSTYGSGKTPVSTSTKPSKANPVIEPPAPGVTTVVASAAPAATTAPVDTGGGETTVTTTTTTVTTSTAPIAAPESRVVVGSHQQGSVNPGLVGLSANAEYVPSKLGLKDVTLTGNTVATAASMKTSSSKFGLVVLSLLVPAALIGGYIFFLARKRKQQVDSQTLGAA